MSELIIRSEAVYVSDGIATDITQLKRSIAPVVRSDTKTGSSLWSAEGITSLTAPITSIAQS